MLDIMKIKEIYCKMEKEEIDEFTNGRYDFWVMIESISKYMVLDRKGRKCYYYDKYFNVDEIIDIDKMGIPLHKLTVEWN